MQRKKVAAVLGIIVSLVLVIGSSVLADEEEQGYLECDVNLQQESIFVEGDNGTLKGNISGEGVVFNADQTIEAEYDVIAMRVPKNANFVIDPYHIAGKGSIWSQKLSFANAGNTDVLLTISNIATNVKEGILVAAEDVDAEEIRNATSKTVRLCMVMDSGEVVYPSQDGTNYSILLAPGQSFYFTIDGDLSQVNPGDWEAGDVSLNFAYEVQIVRQEKESAGVEEPDLDNGEVLVVANVGKDDAAASEDNAADIVQDADDTENAAADSEAVEENETESEETETEEPVENADAEQTEIDGEGVAAEAGDVTPAEGEEADAEETPADTEETENAADGASEENVAPAENEVQEPVAETEGGVEAEPAEDAQEPANEENATEEPAPEEEPTEATE